MTVIPRVWSRTSASPVPVAPGRGQTRLAVLDHCKAETINAAVSPTSSPDRQSSATPTGPSGRRSRPTSHLAINITRSDTPAHLLYPAVSRVQAQLKRWMHGTHQGAVSRDHMTEYLWEFAFRFNRRTAREPGLLPTHRISFPS